MKIHGASKKVNQQTRKENENPKDKVETNILSIIEVLSIILLKNNCTHELQLYILMLITTCLEWT